MIALHGTETADVRRRRCGTKDNRQRNCGATQHARYGFTLVECLISISLLMTVMTLSLALIRTMLRAEANLSERVVETHSRMRLLRRWQADLNPAISARVQNNADGTTELQVLQPGDRQVVYRLDGSRLFREVKSGTDAKVVARDNYFLGHDTVARFERAAQGMTMSWYIVIGKSTQRWQHPDDVSSRDINDRAVEVRIGASLARWRRFATVPVARVTDTTTVPKPDAPVDASTADAAETTSPAGTSPAVESAADPAPSGAPSRLEEPLPPPVEGPTEDTA